MVIVPLFVSGFENMAILVAIEVNEDRYCAVPDAVEDMKDDGQSQLTQLFQRAHGSTFNLHLR